MSAIAAVKTCNDLILTAFNQSATVGFTNTFSPEGFIQPGVVRYVDRSGGIALGYPAVTMQLRPPTKESRIYKTTAKVIVPTLEVTSPSTATGIQPAPTKAYDNTAIVEFMCHERSTLAERRNLLCQLISILCTQIGASDAVPIDSSGSPVPNAVLDFEAPY